MSFLAVFFCILLSAGLLAAAIPNELFIFGNSFTGLICLIPLYCALSKTESLRKTAFYYQLMVLFTHLFSSFWLIHFQDFAVFTLGGSALGTFILAYPFGAAFYYVFKCDIRYRAFIFAIIWTLWEFFKSSGFLAYPWGTILMTAKDLKYLIQFIDVTGVWGLSFIMSLISALLAESLMAWARISCGFSSEKKYPLVKPLILAAALLVSINIYGIFAFHHHEEPVSNIKLALIQQNSDSWSDSIFEESILTGQNLTRSILKEHETADLIVWSETSLPLSYPENKSYYKSFPYEDPFIPFLAEVNKPFLVGTSLVERRKNKSIKYYNGVCLIKPDGNVADSYSKIQLVPFAEFIPLIDNPLVKKVFSSIVGFSSGWAQGKEYKILSIENSKGQTVNFSTPICYEDAFPSLCAKLHNEGSNLMINLTNDAWSKTESAEYQHFVVSMFRAIELRTPLVRSTNSGYTAVVTPKGEIAAGLPLFNKGALYVDVPVYAHRKTFYSIFQDWLPLIFFIIVLKMIWDRQLLFVKRSSIPVYVGCHWCTEEGGEKTGFKRRIRRIKMHKKIKFGTINSMNRILKEPHSILEGELEKDKAEKTLKKRSAKKKDELEKKITGRKKSERDTGKNEIADKDSKSKKGAVKTRKRAEPKTGKKAAAVSGAAEGLKPAETDDTKKKKTLKKTKTVSEEKYKTVPALSKSSSEIPLKKAADKNKKTTAKKERAVTKSSAKRNSENNEIPQTEQSAKPKNKTPQTSPDTKKE